MTKRGYSTAVKNRINNPEATGLGVELGKLCVLHGYSVEEVAGAFKVSRMTAYNWITGRHQPSRHLVDKIQTLVDKLKQKPIPENE
jgi:transcriptional regulator with XRE-family HTH domain